MKYRFLSIITELSRNAWSLKCHGFWSFQGTSFPISYRQHFFGNRCKDIRLLSSSILRLMIESVLHKWTNRFASHFLKNKPKRIINRRRYWTFSVCLLCAFDVCCFQAESGKWGWWGGVQQENGQRKQYRTDSEASPLLNATIASPYPRIIQIAHAPIHIQYTTSFSRIDGAGCRDGVPFRADACLLFPLQHVQGWRGK